MFNMFYCIVFVLSAFVNSVYALSAGQIQTIGGVAGAEATGNINDIIKATRGAGQTTPPGATTFPVATPAAGQRGHVVIGPDGTIQFLIVTPNGQAARLKIPASAPISATVPAPVSAVTAPIAVAPTMSPTPGLDASTPPAAPPAVIADDKTEAAQQPPVVDNTGTADTATVDSAAAPVDATIVEESAEIALPPSAAVNAEIAVMTPETAVAATTATPSATGRTLEFCQSACSVITQNNISDVLKSACSAPGLLSDQFRKNANGIIPGTNFNDVGDCTTDKIKSLIRTQPNKSFISGFYPASKYQRSCVKQCLSGKSPDGNNIFDPESPIVVAATAVADVSATIAMPSSAANANATCSCPIPQAAPAVPEKRDITTAAIHPRPLPPTPQAAAVPAQETPTPASMTPAAPRRPLPPLPPTVVPAPEAAAAPTSFLDEIRGGVKLRPINKTPEPAAAPSLQEALAAGLAKRRAAMNLNQ